MEMDRKDTIQDIIGGLEYLAQQEAEQLGDNVVYLHLAISALKTHPDAQHNEPLTLEELREMDGEPVRHGRWVDEYGGKYANHHYRCSVCKGSALLTSYRDGLFSFQTEQKRSKYCPHCGAKMDGEEMGK